MNSTPARTGKRQKAARLAMFPPVKASEIKPFYTPKSGVVKEQCKTCPFGPNRHLLIDGDEALAKAVESVEAGFDFHCHQTVYKNALRPGKTPSMRPRAEWRACAGAVTYKQTREVETRKDMLRRQGRLIED